MKSGKTGRKDLETCEGILNDICAYAEQLEDMLSIPIMNFSYNDGSSFEENKAEWCESYSRVYAALTTASEFSKLIRANAEFVAEYI
jgi:hypothetical protein